MSSSLLAGSAIGLFIGLLIIMIIVVLLFGFLTYMLFKQQKKPTENANVYNVKRMLARRETQITIEIMNNKDDEAKKTELVNKLRRVRSAEMLVEELLEEEKAISGITDPEEEKKPKKPLNPNKNGKRPAPKPAGEQPAAKEGGQGEQAAKPAANAAKPAEQPVVKTNVKPAKPAKKKKDDKEFTPSED